MRNLEDFYVKNILGDTKVFIRLKPVIFPENEFTYEGTEVYSKDGQRGIEKHELTYKDILKMYEEGFYTIEKDEFDRAEALASIQMKEVVEE